MIYKKRFTILQLMMGIAGFAAIAFIFLVFTGRIRFSTDQNDLFSEDPVGIPDIEMEDLITVSDLIVVVNGQPVRTNKNAEEYKCIEILKGKESFIDKIKVLNSSDIINSSDAGSSAVVLFLAKTHSGVYKIVHYRTGRFPIYRIGDGEYLNVPSEIRLPPRFPRVPTRYNNESTSNNKSSVSSGIPPGRAILMKDFKNLLKILGQH